jgi:type VI secretion system protein VasG
MMRGLASTYEEAHGVTIRDEAIVAAVKLSHRYLSGRQLPDKAVDVLDTAAARVKMELAARPEALVALEAEAAALERERALLARDLAQARGQDEGTLAKLEEKLGAIAERRSTLRARWDAERAAVMRLQEIQRAFSQAPADSDRAALRSALEQAKAKLKLSQDKEPLMHPDVDPEVVAEVIRIAHSGIWNEGAPVGVLLFVGPSGIGTEAVRQRPYSVVLLDECEKADLEVMKRACSTTGG